MADKKKLDQLFEENSPKKPVLRRGQGLKLSTEDKATSSEETEAPEELADEVDAQAQNRTSADASENEEKPGIADVPVRLKRVNRSYRLREDLIKACKQIALDEDRKLYEVMEEALALYVAHKMGTPLEPV